MLVECAHWLLMADAKPDATGRLTARHFGIIEEYLAGLSGESPSVSALATACGFSERYFAKLFREQTNCSVAHYIKSVQTAKAKTYLLETDLPLKEIAHRLGFSSPANFSSSFRAVTGNTPGQFRKSK
jgi:AraC family transcriptional regulator